MLLLLFFNCCICLHVGADHCIIDRKQKHYESKRQPKHETDHFCVYAMQDIIFILPEGIFKTCFAEEKADIQEVSKQQTIERESDQSQTFILSVFVVFHR